MRLGIVVPCYNEEEVLPETARRLETLLGRLEQSGKTSADSQIYFVDDGSSDRTWTIIEDLARSSRRFAGIKLARNRGHQRALLAGLLNAQGDALVSIDADLQDDTEAVVAMVDAFAAGHDIVYGVRGSRATDTGFKRGTASLYYRLLRVFGVDVVHNHADFRLMSRRAIEALRQYGESNLFLRGIIPEIGFRTTTVLYARAARFAGTSKYPLRKMIALAADGITSFSATPLRLIAGIGFLISLVSMGIGLWVLWARFFTDRTIPGWASSLLSTYFIGGLELLSLGVIGEYMAKIYLESKHRPRFVIEKIVGAESDPSGSGAMERTGRC